MTKAQVVEAAVIFACAVAGGAAMIEWIEPSGWGGYFLSAICGGVLLGATLYGTILLGLHIIETRLRSAGRDSEKNDGAGASR